VSRRRQPASTPPAATSAEPTGDSTFSTRWSDDNAGEIGARLRHAEFTTARTGTQHNTREVDYRLPGVPERSYLVFVHYQDRWLYIATGGPTTPTPVTAPTT
jgi:hypothetical protein